MCQEVHAASDHTEPLAPHLEKIFAESGQHIRGHKLRKTGLALLAGATAETGVLVVLQHILFLVLLWQRKETVAGNQWGLPFMVGDPIFVQYGYPSIPSPALDFFTTSIKWTIDATLRGCRERHQTMLSTRWGAKVTKGFLRRQGCGEERMPSAPRDSKRAWKRSMGHKPENSVPLLPSRLGKELTAVADLGGPEQALFAARHPHLSMEVKLCTLCVH